MPDVPALPVILVVDDDPAGLAALRDALARRYAADYRIVAHVSAHAALVELEAIAAQGGRTALVVADLWMPEMNGRELLSRAHLIDTTAQRALLVDWGDHTAAPAILQGCAFGDLENYLVRPWSPPEVHLHPIIGEFLADWTRAHGPRAELVRVVGDEPSPRAYELTTLLSRSGIPHGFYAAGTPEGRRVLEETGLVGSRLPLVLLLDGRALVDPSTRELHDVLGLASPDDSTCDLAIVGAGPAGLAAAVYAASEGLRTTVIEREVVGGQAATSSLIRNYLGFPRGISGAELAQRAYHQAWLFGAKYALGREVCALRAAGRDRELVLSDGTTIVAGSVLVATGASYRRLGVPDLERLVGAGVFYGAMIDQRVMKGRDVVVAGGGNSAGQAVAHLAKHARKVTLLVRGSSLEHGMSEYLVHEIRRATNVDVRLGSEVVGGGGERTLDHVVIRDVSTGVRETLPAAMLFVLIGAVPRTEWLAGTLQRDRFGYVLTGRDVGRARARWPAGRMPSRYETSMPGVFAAGDIRLGSVKRVASSVGEGAAIVPSVHEYLTARVALEPVAAASPDRAAPPDAGP